MCKTAIATVLATVTATVIHAHGAPTTGTFTMYNSNGFKMQQYNNQQYMFGSLEQCMEFALELDHFANPDNGNGILKLVAVCDEPGHGRTEFVTTIDKAAARGNGHRH